MTAIDPKQTLTGSKSRMSDARGVSWSRLLAEGTAIVLSILLAFSIDAFWQNRQGFEHGRKLADTLASEVIENDKMLARQIDQARELSKRARRLLEIMANPGDAGRDLQGLADLGNVFVMNNWAPRYRCVQAGSRCGATPFDR